MRILVDENIDEAFPEFTANHDVLHVVSLGWKGLLNGALLTKAQEAMFELFVTSDKNMRHQQNFRGRPFSLVVLDIHPNILANQVACIPEIEQLIPIAKPGEIYVIDGPHPKRQNITREPQA